MSPRRRPSEDSSSVGYTTQVCGFSGSSFLARTFRLRTPTTEKADLESFVNASPKPTWNTEVFPIHSGDTRPLWRRPPSRVLLHELATGRGISAGAFVGLCGTISIFVAVFNADRIFFNSAEEIHDLGCMFILLPTYMSRGEMETDRIVPMPRRKWKNGLCLYPVARKDTLWK